MSSSFKPNQESIKLLTQVQQKLKFLFGGVPPTPNPFSSYLKEQPVIDTTYDYQAYLNNRLPTESFDIGRQSNLGIAEQNNSFDKNLSVDSEIRPNTSTGIVQRPVMNRRNKLKSMFSEREAGRKRKMYMSINVADKKC